MRVQIIRGSGDSQAPSIVDPLCSAEIAGIQYGTEFLDSNGFDKRLYEVALQHRTLPAVSSIIETADASIGEVFRGRLTGLQINVSRAENTPVDANVMMAIERAIP
jgi:hypothetical protein